MSAVRCPPERELERLLEEDLGALERGGLEQHVESCAQCQAKLHALVTSAALGVDTRWSRAAHSNATSSEEIATFLRRLGRATANSASSLSGNPRDRGLETHVPRIAGYEIQAEIGRGAVGIVYRARHLELDRLVALKVILAGPYSSERARRRFRAESQAIARLRHPRIVQVYEIGEQQGCLYLALELVEGGNLAATIAEGPLPAEKAARIVAELAEAIEHAHAHGVIHRDLKPANVLFDDPARGAVATTRTERELPCELKITDFGLAKVAYEDGSDEHDLTQSGEFLGTPSYTAPEQARGDAKLVGPAADVYSLGAILYELVSGRPPFQAASVVETLMQVAHHDPVAPALLVPGLSRDLDTICARCLQKDPARRYQTANDLALDLRRFLAHEPILARPIGRFERTGRWIRRRPGEAAGIAGGVLLVAVLAGAGLWNAWRDANLERAVHAELTDTSRHAQSSEWAAARAALERARVRLDGGGNDEQKAQLARSSGDLEMAARLDAIRLGRASVDDGLYDVERNRRRADEEYAEAFASAGFGDVLADPVGATARIVASDIRRAWVAALDDWAVCQSGSARDDRRRALLELARRSEDDPSGELLAWRDPEAWASREALTALLATPPPANASIELLIAIGDRLHQLSGDAVPLLERVQRDHPNDFWANFALADALLNVDPARSARYIQAALALRPDSAIVVHNLGRGLALAGSPLEAIQHLQRAIQLDPTFAMAHSNLGNTLAMLRRYDEAVAAGLEAVRLEPDRVEALMNLARTYYDARRFEEAVATLERALALDAGSARLHSGLAVALRMLGRIPEALEHSEKAVELGPNLADVLGNHGMVLAATGRHADSLESLDRALAIEPDEVMALSNRSSTLRALGRLSESLATAERALQLDEKSADAHTSRCMVLAEIGRLDEAVASAQRAADLAPANPRMQQNLGIVLQTVGRLDEAIETYRRSLELAPDSPRTLFVLGLALMTRGDWNEARGALQSFLEVSSPNDPSRSTVQASLARVEAQAAIDARLPSLLAGSESPDDPADALLFASVARLRDRPALAAQLAVDAFASEPELAENLQVGARVEAARSAILAGSGAGADAGALDESARLGWRARAREWLRADLEALRKLADGGVAIDRTKVSQNLARWRHMVEFAPVRDATALAAMSADERAEWESFWNDVGALSRSVAPMR